MVFLQEVIRHILRHDRFLRLLLLRGLFKRDTVELDIRHSLRIHHNPISAARAAH